MQSLTRLGQSLRLAIACHSRTFPAMDTLVSFPMLWALTRRGCLGPAGSGDACGCLHSLAGAQRGANCPCGWPASGTPGGREQGASAPSPLRSAGGRQPSSRGVPGGRGGRCPGRGCAWQLRATAASVDTATSLDRPASRSRRAHPESWMRRPVYRRPAAAIRGVMRPRSTGEPLTAPLNA